MNIWQDFFKGKRVTLMGLGLLGRGLGDAIFLAQHGAELIITDLRDEKSLAPSLAKLKQYRNIRYTLGEHKLENFCNRDFVIKAAGVPLGSPYIAEAQKNSIPVYMSTALFAKFAREIGAIIVGVTGTRGKSTVTHMIYEALIGAGKSVHLGGNVQGVSTLSMLPRVKRGDICVLELDSWQLQGFATLEISPDIAVFTNLKTDHLNYYSDEETYFADKANIYAFQGEKDVLITTREILDRWLSSKIPKSKVIISNHLPASSRLQILGEHNRGNAALAMKALQELGVEKGNIDRSLSLFKPLGGRLQFVRTVNGIDIYNDTNATTPDATVAAIAALLGKNKRIVLIAGGSDKKVSIEILANVLNTSDALRELILLPGTGTEKLKMLLKRKYSEGNSMEEIIQEAMNVAKNGDVILFSPAFASFGKWFKNEYDRGEQFVRIVSGL